MFLKNFLKYLLTPGVLLVFSFLITATIVVKAYDVDLSGNLSATQTTTTAQTSTLTPLKTISEPTASTVVVSPTVNSSVSPTTSTQSPTTVSSPTLVETKNYYVTTEKTTATPVANPTTLKATTPTPANTTPLNYSQSTAVEPPAATTTATVPATTKTPVTTDAQTTPTTETTATQPSVTVVPCTHTYGPWSDCRNGWQVREYLGVKPDGCKPTGTAIEALRQVCTADTKITDCTEDKWRCVPQPCRPDGTLTYKCELIFDCLEVENKAPVPKTETCVYQPTTATKETTKETDTVKPTAASCTYKYSDWSKCVNERQTRTIVSRAPANCTDVKEPEALARECCLSDDLWQCGQWSDCLAEGFKIRKCELVYDCKTDNKARPAEKTSCAYQAAPGKTDQTGQTNQPGSDLPTPAVDVAPSTATTDTSTPVNEAEVFVTNNPTLQTDTAAALSQPRAEDIVDNLPNVCREADISNSDDCELFIRQENIVEECLSKNINSRGDCRQYLYATYGRPLACRTLTDDECMKLVNVMFLADLKDELTVTTTKAILATVTNKPATIDAVNQTIKTSDGSDAQISSLPFSPVEREVKVKLLSAADNQSKSILPVIIVVDTDGDGLPDDAEQRLGTDPNNPNTDGDGYNDSLEVKTGNNPLGSGKAAASFYAPIDKAVANGQNIEAPKLSKGTFDKNLKVTAATPERPDETKLTGILKLKGQALPGETVSIFIYSAMPILVTAKADDNGNWVYNLDKTLVDGKHEVYVAINDEAGRLKSKSTPLTFFIKEAEAVTMDDYVSIDEASYAPDNTTNLLIIYSAASALLILCFVSFFIYARRKVAV